jgi:hypothetical protein
MERGKRPIVPGPGEAWFGGLALLWTDPWARTPATKEVAARMIAFISNEFERVASDVWKGRRRRKCKKKS